MLPSSGGITEFTLELYGVSNKPRSLQHLRKNIGEDKNLKSTEGLAVAASLEY